MLLCSKLFRIKRPIGYNDHFLLAQGGLLKRNPLYLIVTLVEYELITIAKSTRLIRRANFATTRGFSASNIHFILDDLELQESHFNVDTGFERHRRVEGRGFKLILGQKRLLEVLILHATSLRQINQQI